ncbi:MAG TPA: ParA family protein [Chloroflexia bacterium]|nr:ParA family protein [Chloroflexia bacterium]
MKYPSVNASPNPNRAHIYSFANQKGGVGKTTTAVNLAAYLAAGGHRVLLVDADSQANATSSLGIDKNRDESSLYHVLMGEATAEQAIIPIDRPIFNGCLHLLPSSVELAGVEVELAALGQGSREYRLKQGLATVLYRYDYILVDCPPSLGLLTLNALTAADAVIIALQCEYLALEGLMQLTNTISLVLRGLNRNLRVLGIAMTMYDSRTNLSAQVVQEVRTHFPNQIFNTLIPRSVRLSEAPSYGLTILEYDPNSRGALAYADLAHELVARTALSEGLTHAHI